jgi:tetratricopeptide (TPR) repeat protein
MPTCIVCHLPVRSGEEGQQSVECPNGHPVHLEPCLKQWFITGKHPTCPFCREPYAPAIQDLYQKYIEESETAKNDAASPDGFMDDALAATMQALTEREDLLTRVSNLIQQGKLDGAANVLFDYQDNKDKNDPEVAYLLGMVFFLQQKYGLAVNHLMNAVKIDFKMPMAFYYLARCFLELEMPEKAVWAAERAITHFGDEDTEARAFCADLIAKNLPI